MNGQQIDVSVHKAEAVTLTADRHCHHLMIQNVSQSGNGDYWRPIGRSCCTCKRAACH